MLNFALLLFASLAFIVAHDLIYHLQSYLFPMSEEAYNGYWFITIGIWKILTVVFFLIPYVAIRLAEKKP